MDTLARVLNAPTEAGGGRVALNGEDCVVERLVIAGWTGRNSEQVEAHIRELEELGVPRPEKTPTFYRVAASLLTQASEIQVAGAKSSGEVEPVLVATGRSLWVGVGSDHTDRRVETYDVTVSKQVCAKPVGTEFWAYDEVAAHWDLLRLRAYAHENGSRVVYQEGSLAAIRAPEDLLARYADESEGLIAGSMMFCGTLAVRGRIRYADAFTIELEDPVQGRAISHTYAVQVLPR